MAKVGKKSNPIKNLPARGLTSKQAKRIKGGLLPAVRTGYQVSMADGSVRNLITVKTHKV